MKKKIEAGYELYRSAEYPLMAQVRQLDIVKFGRLSPPIRREVLLEAASVSLL